MFLLLEISGGILRMKNSMSLLFYIYLWPLSQSLYPPVLVILADIEFSDIWLNIVDIFCEEEIS